MNDRECVRFLQWALPRLEMRWEGFRRVRRQVRRRLNRRLDELHLGDGDAYRAYLERHASEWPVLDGLCRVTVSRFYRNRGVFEFLLDTVLPHLADRALGDGDATIRAWCAGCASGEEAYATAIGWPLRRAGPQAAVDIRIVATDVDAHMIERARRAEYPPSSVRELPERWLAVAFERAGSRYRLRSRYRRLVTFRREDLRERMPTGPFDVVLCRNLVFTYYQGSLQRRLASALASRIVPGGALVVGHHESLPEGAPDFEDWDADQGTYRRRPEPDSAPATR